MNEVGLREIVCGGFLRSRLEKVTKAKIKSEDQYFNVLISKSEYSFDAFEEDASEGIYAVYGDRSFQNLFHYDYSNDVDYSLIYRCLRNGMIKSPTYTQYCKAHKREQRGLCLNCLERYRVVTRNLIPLLKMIRKDLCSIYFIDILYDLLRFENRDLYAFITYTINHFSDGSSFKAFVAQFGKKRVYRLLKTMNRPFRRIDFKFVLKKFIPVLYAVCAYCANTRTDCLDHVYDYMLHQGLSMFKTVPSEHVVVGYCVGSAYRIDVIETRAVLDFEKDRDFMISSNTMLEGLNFGFYKRRLQVYKDTNAWDNSIKQELRSVYADLTFEGRSVFTGDVVSSENAIVIGFLKKSNNTFQNFRLDIHIESIITNNPAVDKLRLIQHSKWNFEDNMTNICYQPERINSSIKTTDTWALDTGASQSICCFK